VLAGGLSILLKRFYPLAIAASIVAMMPVAPCFVLGLPGGVWALIVLHREDVRQMFSR
jgi:hypothetical protein